MARLVEADWFEAGLLPRPPSASPESGRLERCLRRRPEDEADIPFLARLVFDEASRSAPTIGTARRPARLFGSISRRPLSS